MSSAQIEQKSYEMPPREGFTVTHFIIVADIDAFLYLPEVLYVLFFIWLLCSGQGKFSVDYWLAGKLLR